MEQNIFICPREGTDRKEVATPRLRGPPGGQAPALTQQREHAGQDGDQGARAEPRGQHVGLGVAGLRHAVRVAVTDADGERVGAAERGRAAVHDEDGQVVHRLLLPPEAVSPGQDRGRVVWEGEIKV